MFLWYITWVADKIVGFTKTTTLQHTKVDNTHKFAPENYPEFVKELNEIKLLSSSVPHEGKGDIIISFFKTHSITNHLLKTNPELAAMATSGRFKSTNIESLLASHRHNKHFLHDVEEYIRQQVV